MKTETILNSFFASLFVVAALIASSYSGESQAFRRANQVIETLSPIALSVDGDTTKSLKPGQRNSQVLELQQTLSDLGFYAGQLDSAYGPKTKTAVRLFQKSKDLKLDGIAGPDTLRVLYFKTNTEDSSDIMCADVYEPVCARLTLNCVQAPCPQPEATTYGNSCYAAREGASIVSQGECSTSIVEIKKPCTREYAPVCGSNDAGVFQTFANSCLLDNSEFLLNYSGVCRATKPTEEFLDSEKKKLTEKLMIQLNSLRAQLALIQKSEQ